MKAVIVEIHNRYAAVLSDDGCIVKVRNKNYEIGQVIQISQSQLHRNKKIAACAASVAATLVLGTGTWAYASPYSYVSVDINPSIEFTVNRFDRVLKVQTYNDDGAEILKKVNLADLKNEKINDALSYTVRQITDEGYFEDNVEVGLVIATSAKKEEKAEKLAKELLETVDTELEDSGKEVQVEAYSVGYERVQKAKELGVTPGKLNLVEKLQESSDDPESINMEEWLNKPVKEIMKATRDNKKFVSKDADSSTGVDEKSKNTKPSKNGKNESWKQEKNEQKALEKAEKERRKTLERLEKWERKALEKAEREKQKAANIFEVFNRKLEQAKQKASEKEIKAAQKATEKSWDAANKAKEKEEKLKNKDKKKENKSAKNNNKRNKYNKKKNNEKSYKKQYKKNKKSKK